MRAVDIIRKKRIGEILSANEIHFLIEGFTLNKIADYQMSAFLMACFVKPPTFEETLELCKAMMNSGSIIDFSDLKQPKIDKHSTGGVGDKTSLIISPIVASCDIAVPMISGRGLGHTGGTLDKLESIPGFQVNLSIEQFKSYLKKTNMAMMGQTPEIAPADKRIYALRDVTATVDSKPLISASIMSKKIAEGSDGLVLDVKYGKGAFMKTIQEATELAEWLVKIGTSFNKKMSALITNMNEPLGFKVGNSLEVEECIDILKGKGPEDLKHLSLHLSAHMLVLGNQASSVEEGISKAKQAIQSGKALEKFKALIEEQGGNAKVIDSFSYLPQSKYKKEFKSSSKGFISDLDAYHIGIAAGILGCGREKTTDPIDPAVGFNLHKKVTDAVEENESILTIHYNDEKKLQLAEAELNKAIQVTPTKPQIKPLIEKVI